MEPVAAHATVERAVRDSYGRLVAFLSARSRDMAAVEDALAEAFQAALESWPRTGVPAKPEAWLLVVARRRLTDGARRSILHQQNVPTLLAITEEAQDRASAESIFPDERLKLLFVCAHPAIDASARTPLMLQTVLGLDAVRIASCFLVKPATMAQRLTRAKAKIRDARIGFEIPESSELPQRLGPVLDAIYAVYGTGWNELTFSDTRNTGLQGEALILGGLLLRQFPEEPEVKGLLALMLYCEARRDARLNDAGQYVPLTEQDTIRWSRPLLAEANRLLIEAEQAKNIGYFQLEAAIQSAHMQRAQTGQTDWEEVALLYEGLVRLAPTVGAKIGRAAALAEARGAAAGWAAIEEVPKELIKSYQPYWAVAGHLLAVMNKKTLAKAAYARAIGLCESHAMREFLTRKAAGLGES